MRYLDVCAGISASTVAWKPLGWAAAAYSEIEPAPRAVLAHRYPETPIHGDFTTIEGDEYGAIDLLVGGTPCQDFSIAGLRAGLAGDRGNLSLQFLLLARRTGARWVVWENVPGVFSSLSHDAPDACPPAVDLDSSDGPEDGKEVVVEDEYDADESHALGCFLAGLSELGYGVAYRVLDAQFAGVPQRRRRIFAVGYLGDWRRAAAVLFERHSLQGHPAPSREAGKDLTGSLSASAGRRCGVDDPERGGLIAGTLSAAGARSRGAGTDPAMIASTGDVAHCLNAGGMGRQDYETETLIAHALRGEGFDASEDGTGRRTPLVPVPFDTTQITSAANYSNPKPGDPCHPLAAGMHPPAIAFNSREDCCSSDALFGSLGSQSPQAQAVAFPINPNALRGDTSAITPSRDAAGRVRLRDPGLGVGADGDPADTLQAAGPGAVGTASAVRRLTPRECERLQGFPDDYTLVPYRRGMMADGPRYKALGNSMAVPVMRWIGERIAAVDALSSRKAAA